ncbi:hypothetical protein ABIC86_005656 [Paenibacillus sp. DS2363]
MMEPTSVRIVVKSWANQINTCRTRFVVSEITAELALFCLDSYLKQHGVEQRNGCSILIFIKELTTDHKSFIFNLRYLI